MKGNKINPLQKGFYHQPPTFNMPKRGNTNRNSKSGGRSSGRRG